MGRRFGFVADHPVGVLAALGLLTALEGQIMETRAISVNRGVEARMLTQIRRW